MFRRPRHRAVHAVLRSFQPDLLSSCRFLFAGGTRIVLELDEFRESLDIDFLCSDGSGYGELRLAATQLGYSGLFTGQGLESLRFPREMRVDQYGIRFSVVHEELSVRVELIREARIELGPGVRPAWSPVDCLSLDDCYAEKLLATSDRWADRQVLSRDVIDLAALRERLGPIPPVAWAKVQTAYRSAPRSDLEKALRSLEEDDAYLQRCFEGLQIQEAAPIRQGLLLLRQDLAAEED